jgi:DNA primase
MPSFDMSGELNYYTCRAIYKTRPKYINPGVHREDIIFNEMNINWKEPLILVEGPLDLIKCGDRNATCLLGSDLTSDYKLFLLLAKNKTPVTLALDPDAKQKTLRIAEFLSEYDIPVKILDIPEPYQDVGELTKEEFSSILSSAIVYTKDYLLRAKISNILRT